MLPRAFERLHHIAACLVMFVRIDRGNFGDGMMDFSLALFGARKQAADARCMSGMPNQQLFESDFRRGDLLFRDPQ